MVKRLSPAFSEQPKMSNPSTLKRSGFAAVSGPSGRSSSRQTAVESDRSATGRQAHVIIRWRNPYRTASWRSVGARHRAASPRRVGRSASEWSQRWERCSLCRGYRRWANSGRDRGGSAASTASRADGERRKKERSPAAKRGRMKTTRDDKHPFGLCDEHAVLQELLKLCGRSD